MGDIIYGDMAYKLLNDFMTMDIKSMKSGAVESTLVLVLDLMLIVFATLLVTVNKRKLSINLRTVAGFVICIFLPWMLSVLLGRTFIRADSSMPWIMTVSYMSVVYIFKLFRTEKAEKALVAHLTAYLGIVLVTEIVLSRF